MTLAALQALQADPDTHVIVLISKPPAPAVILKVLEAVTASSKPTVLCFLGAVLEGLAVNESVFPVATLQEAALQAACLAGAVLPTVPESLAEEDRQLKAQANELRQRLTPGQRFLRGLFSGGTLCYETQVLWRDRLSDQVRSNAPLRDIDRLPDSAVSQGHTAVDLGEEEFTIGRPHPMIDNDLRIRRLLQETRDPETAVVLLDVVLGFGAHPGPAAELVPAVARGRELALEKGREIIFIASITGTSGDPQGYDQQVSALEEAGVVVCHSNASAARLAALIVT
jgi:FdrA protein